MYDMKKLDVYMKHEKKGKCSIFIGKNHQNTFFYNSHLQDRCQREQQNKKVKKNANTF
jgi:hypothetical protein